MQSMSSHQAAIRGPIVLAVLSCFLATGVEAKWKYNHGDANFVNAIRNIVKAQLTPAIAEVVAEAAKNSKITKLDNEACRLAVNALDNLFKIIVPEKYDQARTILLEYVYKQVMKEHDDAAESNLAEMYKELMKGSIYLWTIIEYCATVPPLAYRIDYSTNGTEKNKIAKVLTNLYPKST